MRIGEWIRSGRAAGDSALALAVGVLAAFGSARAAMGQVPERHALDEVAYALIGIAAAALVVRRLQPLAALALATGCVVVYLLLRYPYGPVFVPVMIAVYTVAETLTARRAVAASAAVASAILVPHVVQTRWAQTQWAQWQGEVTSMVISLSVIVGLPLAVGTVVRQRRAYEAERRGAAAREREETFRRRSDEERLRIAREVHDVVGHSLAVISVQAGVALHVVDRRPEQARTALEVIRRTSKEALDELRTTLAVFRGTEETPAPRAPTPGLGQLDALADSMREGGLPVRLVIGDPPGTWTLPAAVDVAAYRIVQESLTNVLRHAGQASATVRVDRRPREVVLEITDDGRARVGPASGGGSPGPAGHGIAGMRERAAAVGGDLVAGPRSEGGFRVLAHLPLGEPAGEGQA